MDWVPSHHRKAAISPVSLHVPVVIIISIILVIVIIIILVIFIVVIIIIVVVIVSNQQLSARSASSCRSSSSSLSSLSSSSPPYSLSLSSSHHCEYHFLTYALCSYQPGQPPQLVPIVIIVNSLVLNLLKRCQTMIFIMTMMRRIMMMMMNRIMRM